MLEELDLKIGDPKPQQTNYTATQWLSCHQLCPSSVMQTTCCPW